MDLKLRDAQKKVLKAFADNTRTFALSGGTALELYYLHHRFSADLDFFSPAYNLKEIDKLVLGFKRYCQGKIKLESEFIVGDRANVRFYALSVKELERPLKIDFIEDVLLNKPGIRKFNGVPVYSAKSIYLQKLFAMTGSRLLYDEVGRQFTRGRKEARDVFDVYMLSKKISPLHVFLKGVSGGIQKGMVHWYRTFSRQDLKLALLDLDIYDSNFDAREMSIYLENEIQEFVRQVL